MTPDVRVMLFACSTGHGDATVDPRARPTAIGSEPDTGREPDPTRGEGGIADAWRDELLARGHAQAAVGGHILSGHCERNTTRYFYGANTVDDSRTGTRFPAAFRAAEYQRIVGVPMPPDAAQRVTDAFIAFNRRELLMLVDSPAHLADPAACQAAWRRFADQNAERVRRRLAPR